MSLLSFGCVRNERGFFASHSLDANSVAKQNKLTRGSTRGNKCLASVWKSIDNFNSFCFVAESRAQVLKNV